MHTLQSIISQLTSMEHAITELGYQGADSDLNLHWSALSPLYLALRYSADGEYFNQTFARPGETDEDLSGLLAEAWDYIRQLKTPEQAKREAFLHEFGRTIDKARDLGLSVDFINPLEDSMRQLSENILEDHSGAAQ